MSARKTTGTKSPINSSASKFKYMPVRACDMDLTMFGYPSANKTESSRKPPKYAVPIRTCDMDLRVFEDEAAQPKKPVRKQLWPAENKKKYSTNFKPHRIRKSTSTNLKPLPDSHQKIFPSVQTKQKEKKIVQPSSKIKTPIAKTLLPSVIVHEPESSYKENDFNQKFNRLELNINEKFNHLESKIQLKWDEMLNTIELKFNEKICNFENKLEEILNKVELGINYKCKNCGCNNMSTQEIQIDRKQDENKCSSSRTVEEQNTVENLNEEINRITPTKMNRNHSFNSTPEVNNLIDKALSSIEINKNKTILKTEIKTEDILESSDSQFTLEKALSVIEINQNKTELNTEIENEDILEMSDSPFTLDNKILLDETKKCINKFEILESKLQDGSPMSNEFSLSDNDSPFVIRKDINWLINDKNDFKSPLRKSLSASFIESHKKKKRVTFQSKSQIDLQSDSVSSYNEMRNNVPFLHTPKNTRIAANLMTPSVQNSKMKMLSRRIQEQCLLLE